MAQSDLLARLNGVIRRTIEARQSDGDIVEWSTALVPVYAECEHGHTEYEFVLGVYARVYCPETDMTLVSNLMWGLEDCADETIAGLANRWWDSVTLERMSEVLGPAEDSEDDDEEHDTPTG